MSSALEAATLRSKEYFQNLYLWNTVAVSEEDDTPGAWIAVLTAGYLAATDSL